MVAELNALTFNFQTLLLENYLDTYDLYFDKHTQSIEFDNLKKYKTIQHKTVKVMNVVSNIPNPPVILYTNIFKDNNTSLNNTIHFNDNIPIYDNTKNVVFKPVVEYPYNEVSIMKFNINNKLINDQYIRFRIQVSSYNPLII